MSVALHDFRGWRLGWQKPDRRPMWQWAHDYLTLPSSYHIPGRFDVAINRPLIEVFDAIQNPLVRRVRFRKPPRFGGSLVADVAIPWILCNDPGPLAAYFPKQEFAEERMREKLWPLWLSCAPFKALLPKGRFDRTNTAIYFGPFFFTAMGVAPANLQGKGFRWVFNDETWLPVWQTLYNQAVARTRDFARTQCEKIVDISQPGIANDVEDRNFREGHQATWAYRSPVDGKHYILGMGGKREDRSRWGLVWNDDAKRKDGTWNRARAIETAKYVCRETGHEWKDSPETIAEWNRDGKYLIQNSDSPSEIRSFSAPALLNNTFAALVTRKIAAMEQAAYGDMSGMRDFAQQDEVRPWEETHLSVTIDGESSGYKLADYEHGEVWAGEKYRTLMADRQKGMAGDTPHRWCEVRAWKGDGSSRQLYYGRVDTKEAMRELQHRYLVKDRCVWQDARWESAQVYEECAEYGWIACFGAPQNGWTHIVPDPRDRRLTIKLRLPFSPWQQTTVGEKRVNYLLFASNFNKDILANLVAGRGVPYEHPDDVSDEYKAQMQGEHKILKAGKYIWEKIHSTKPNHAWDAAVQGISFGLLMKLLALPKKPDEEEHAAIAAA